MNSVVPSKIKNPKSCLKIDLREIKQCEFCDCNSSRCNIKLVNFSSWIPVSIAVCADCDHRMTGRAPLEWLRSLKQTDPVEWQELVNLHKQSERPLRGLIRMINDER
jgi:hypothetical protein